MDIDIKAKQVSSLVQPIVFQTDRDGILRFANPAWVDLTDWIVPECLGQSLTSYLVPVQTAEPVLLQALLRGEVDVWHSQALCSTSSGQQRLVEVQAWPLCDVHGHCTGVIGTIRPIAPQVAARHTNFSIVPDLAAERLQAILEHAPISIWGKDAEGRYETWSYNRELTQGQVARDILGKTDDEIFPAERAAEHKYTDALALAQNKAVSFQSEYRFDNTLSYYFATKFPLRHPDGTPYAVYGLAVNITERVLAEQALRASEERYRNLVEAIPDTLLIVQDEQVVYANAAVAVLARTAQVADLIGESIYRFILPERHDGLRRRLDQLYTNEQAPLHHRGWFVRYNGETCDVEVIIAPATWQGTPAAQFLLRDISKRLQADADRQMLERKMLEVQKLESLGVLAGGIAHDFNNFLAAITGNTDLALLDLEPTSPLYAHLTQIELAAQRATDLVHQMLSYAGRGRFDTEHLDLNDLVSEMALLLHSSISKQATLQLDLSDAALPLQADATQIRQVVMNLITNASEAMGSAGGTIGVSTGMQTIDTRFPVNLHVATELSTGRYVTLQVSDTGCGMDSATQHKIFEPFFTTKFTGRGLGLAAVLGIVRSHAGALHVSSELGVGTVFTVWLPLSTAPALAVVPEPTAADVSTLAQQTILVVDDEPDVLRVAVAMLNRLGFRTLGAEDGKAGLDLVVQHADGLAGILLDWTMPRMGGEAMLREVQRIAPHLPVVVMSGYTADDVVSSVAKATIAGFLPKPFTVQMMRQASQLFAPG